jgi:hypothetical protein
MWGYEAAAKAVARMGARVAIRSLRAATRPDDAGRVRLP